MHTFIGNVLECLATVELAFLAYSLGCAHFCILWRELKMTKKALKQIISFSMAFVMLIAVTAVNTIAYADVDPSISQKIELDTRYSKVLSPSDPYYNGWSNFSYHSFCFIVPLQGTIEVYVESADSDVVGQNINEALELYRSSSIDSYIWRGDLSKNQKYNTNRSVYYNSAKVSLTKGTYYLAKPYCNMLVNNGSYEIKLKFTPSFSNTSISKLSAKKKSFKTQWKKANGVTGYEIQYSLKKNMKSSKKIIIKNAASTSKTIKKLKAKKKYYVRIRTYKTVNINGTNKTYYGKWSSKKTVKTKK